MRWNPRDGHLRAAGGESDRLVGLEGLGEGARVVARGAAGDERFPEWARSTPSLTSRMRPRMVALSSLVPSRSLPVVTMFAMAM